MQGGNSSTAKEKRKYTNTPYSMLSMPHRNLEYQKRSSGISNPEHLPKYPYQQKQIERKILSTSKHLQSYLRTSQGLGLP